MLKSPARFCLAILVACPMLRPIPAGGNILESPRPPLRPGPSPAAKDTLSDRYGLLWLVIDPADAEVTLDGSFLDLNVWLVSLSPGTHVISVSKPGFRTVAKSFGIRRGDSLSLEVRLPRVDASLPDSGKPAP